MRAAALAVAACAALGCSAGRPLADGAGGLVVTAVTSQDSDAREAGVGDPYDRNYAHGRETETYDYDRFEDLVVHVSGAGTPVTAAPAVVAYGPGGFETPVAAAAEGQAVRFENRTDRPLVFFGVVEATGESCDEWPEVPPGGSATWTTRGRDVVLVYVDGDGAAEAVLHLGPPGIAAVLATDESLVLSTLPPGRYRVEGWHRVLPATRHDVDVAAGRWQEVEVLFSTDALGAASP